jgi:hypothetical protein
MVEARSVMGECRRLRNGAQRNPSLTIRKSESTPIGVAKAASECPRANAKKLPTREGRELGRPQCDDYAFGASTRAATKGSPPSKSGATVSSSNCTPPIVTMVP